MVFEIGMDLVGTRLGGRKKPLFGQVLHAGHGGEVAGHSDADADNGRGPDQYKQEFSSKVAYLESIQTSQGNRMPERPIRTAAETLQD